MKNLTEEQQNALRQELIENPAQILEMVASKYQCNLETVLLTLPNELISVTKGERFVEIMQYLHELDDEMTFIIHSEDAIAEVTGKISKGSIARGFYNIEHQENGGLHGHFRYENCANIYLLDRPFMGKRTVSLIFINKEGNAMFKIFAGREKIGGELKENQVEAFHTLIKPKE